MIEGMPHQIGVTPAPPALAIENDKQACQGANTTRAPRHRTGQSSEFTLTAWVQIRMVAHHSRHRSQLEPCDNQKPCTHEVFGVWISQVVGGWEKFCLGPRLRGILTVNHQGTKSAEGGASFAPYHDHKAYCRGTPLCRQSLMGPRQDTFFLSQKEG